MLFRKCLLFMLVILAFVLCLLVVGCHSKTKSTSVLAVTTPLVSPTGNITNSTAQSQQPGATRSPLPQNSIHKEELLKMTVVGDILLGRRIRQNILSQKKGYVYPFEEVADILKEGDIIFGNLEEPITSSTQGLLDIKHGGKYVLKNDVQAFEGLKYAGFNMFSLANNHILDYYDKGLTDTVDLLDKHGIAHSGAGKNLEDAKKPGILTRKGLKIGLIAYTDMAEVLYKGNPPLRFIAKNDKYGVAPRPYRFNDELKKDLQRAKKEVDILMVSLHWGKEESFEILPSQIDFAHQLIDNGVDVILGHHPHQFQGIEIYKSKPIFYSLGNFIFDQNDPENQESFIVNMEYTGKKLTSLKAIPVRTINKLKIVPVKGKDAASLLSRQVGLCNVLFTKSRIQNDTIVFELQ